MLYFVRNKRILNSDVISILSESSECETIIVHRKKILEMSFYEQMLIIIWREYMCNEVVVNKIGTIKSLILKMRKRQLKFMEHEEGRLGKFITHRMYWEECWVVGNSQQFAK